MNNRVAKWIDRYYKPERLNREVEVKGRVFRMKEDG